VAEEVVAGQRRGREVIQHYEVRSRADIGCQQTGREVHWGLKFPSSRGLFIEGLVVKVD